MNNICQECGMVCTSPIEYHPYAACLMFKACHDGDTVRANLEAVRNDGAPGAPHEAAAVGQWPAELPLRIQVSYSPGDWDTFIYGVSGHLTMSELTKIDAAIRDEDSEELFKHGPGDYLLSGVYCKGQYGFEGRCEFAPYWDLTIDGFRPLAALAGGDGGEG